jgi:hypothetical protein
VRLWLAHALLGAPDHPLHLRLCRLHLEVGHRERNERRGCSWALQPAALMRSASCRNSA